MARDTIRVRRGERGVDENGDPKLGFDEALVGSGSDGSEIEIDPSERDNNPFLGSEQDDENWELPEDKRGKKPEVRHEEQRTRGGAGYAEEGDDEEDLRLVYDEPDEEQRGGRRSRRNAARRRAIDQRDQHIAYLTDRLQKVEEAQAGLQGGQFDLSARDVEQRITYHQNAIDRADQEIARAIKDSDGDTVVAIQRERDRISQQLWQLQGYRQNMEDHARRMAQGGSVEQQLTPQQVAALQAQDADFGRMKDVFMDRYPWYDESGNDPDHDFVRNLGARLHRDGLQRHMKVFWHEMERGMKQAGFRPERGDDWDDEQDNRGFQSRREFQSRRVSNGNGYSGGGETRRANIPPTGIVRSTLRSGRGNGSFALSEDQVDLLRQEGLMEKNLTEAEQAKKTRIMDAWRAG